MAQRDESPTGRTVIGGRHGSPSLTIALPFSQITSADDGLRDAVADLAHLVARLSGTASADEAERVLVREAAEELATRLTSRR